MAELKLILNQKEIQQLMSCDESGLFTQILRNSIDELLSGEQSEAAENIISDEYGRGDFRTGTDESVPPAVNIGSVSLIRPEDVEGSFENMVLRNYSVSDAGFISGMADMTIHGGTDNGMRSGLEGLFGKIPDEREVSMLKDKLEGIIDDFRTRPLTDSYPFMFVSAEEFTVQKCSKTEKVIYVLALAITRKGVRDIVACGVYPDTSGKSWHDFLSSIRNRGLTSPVMLISDIYPELKEAAADVYPDTPWQFCQNQLTRRTADLAPEQYAEELRADIRQALKGRDCTEISLALKRLAENYSDKAPAAADYLLANSDDSMSVYQLPEKLQQIFRTTRRLDSVRKELRRRSDSIGILPGGISLDRVLSSFIIDHNEKLRDMIRIFHRNSLIELERKSGDLRSRAAEQHRRLSAVYH